MTIELGYGKTKIPFGVPSSRLNGVLVPDEKERETDETEEIERALDNPFGTDRLENIVTAGDTVAVITSDITRPMPSKKVLPPVL